MSDRNDRLRQDRLAALRAIATRSYEESVAAFEKLRADFLLGASEPDALEIRRLIANDLFDLALRYERPFAEWNQLFEQLRELGFSYLGPKVSAYYGYVEECLLLGRDALAAGSAWEIVAELSSERLLSETLSLEDRLKSIHLFACKMREPQIDSIDPESA